MVICGEYTHDELSVGCLDLNLSLYLLMMMMVVVMMGMAMEYS